MDERGKAKWLRYSYRMQATHRIRLLINKIAQNVCLNDDVEDDDGNAGDVIPYWQCRAGSGT